MSYWRLQIQTGQKAGMPKSEVAKLSAKERHKLKGFLKELSGYRGRGTELVSVYIPAGQKEAAGGIREVGGGR